MLFIFTYVLLLVLFNFDILMDFTYIILFVLLLVYFVKLFVGTKDNISTLNLKFIFLNILLQLQGFFTFVFALLSSVFSNIGFSLKWKPLFKKSSYFGLYRSTRNQFLNK